MTYPRCWDHARVQAILTTESRQKSREIFLHTHRPFQTIRVDRWTEGSLQHPFISETTLRTILLDRPLTSDNRLFFLVGEAGSGKSELSQWLEYTIDDPSCLPLHIPRRMTTARHVAQLLRSHLAPEGAAPAMSSAPPERQATYIQLTAVMMVYDRAHASLTPPDRWEALIMHPSITARIIEALHTALENPQAVPHLAYDPFLALARKMHVLGAAEQAPIAYTALNALLIDAWNHLWWISDLRDLFTTLSQLALATERRPLLLIEDITAFQTFGDSLLDYLFDLSSGHMDALIGITTGYERTQLMHATLEGDLTHIHQRLCGRFVLTDERGCSYGLEEDIIELTRSYMRAIRPACDQCMLKPSCHNVFGTDLYPFTEISLRRAFDHLREDGSLRQTPRLFLEHVIRDALLADDPPPVVFDRSPMLEQPPALFRTEHALPSALESAMRWYGEAHTTSIRLHEEILTAWQITVQSAEASYESPYIGFPRTYVAPPDPESLDRAHWNQEIREFQQWIQEGTAYPSRETLKQGIEKLLLMHGDPRALGNPTAHASMKADIVYTRSHERLPIVLGGASGDVPHPHIVALQIVPCAEDRAILEELVYWTLSGEPLEQICHNLATTFAWAENQWMIYHSQLRTDLQHYLGGLSHDVFIVQVWHLLTTLIGHPWSDPPPLYMHDHDPPLYDHLTCWSPTDHPACYHTGNALYAWYDVARCLFLSEFGLKDTLLDRERYDHVMDGYSANHVLLHLATLDEARIKAIPYKINPGNHALADLLRCVRAYAQALCTLNLPALIETEAAHLDLRTQHLSTQTATSSIWHAIEHLQQTYGALGLMWDHGWDAVLAIFRTMTPALIDNLATSVLMARTRLMELDPQSPFDYIAWLHIIQPVRDHPYWTGVQVLVHIQDAMLAAAQQRYRKKGRLLTRTAAYRHLGTTITALSQTLQEAP